MGHLRIVPGFLQGMGYSADCLLLVVLNSRAPDYDWQRARWGYSYSNCQILRAPNYLPDGDYIATFDDQAVEVHKMRSLWCIRGIPAAQQAL